MKRKGCNNDRSAGIEIWLCIDIENRKTFDVFAMIWCVLGWLRPVGEIRAEKRAVQSISFHHSYLLIVLHKTKKTHLSINSPDVSMLLHVASVDRYTNHCEHPFPKLMFHPAKNINDQMCLESSRETY